MKVYHALLLMFVAVITLGCQSRMRTSDMEIERSAELEILRQFAQDEPVDLLFDVVKHKWDFTIDDYGFIEVPCEPSAPPDNLPFNRRPAVRKPLWQYGRAEGIRFPGKCWATNLDGDYPDQCGEGLRSPPFRVGKQSRWLEVFHHFATEISADGGNVKVNGKLVTPVGGYPAEISKSQDDQTPCVGSAPAFSGLGPYRVDVFDLQEFSGKIVQVQFDFGSNSSVQGKGWYILGIRVVGKQTIYQVNPQGTGDYPDIKSAVAAANNGDIIELAPGAYVGSGNRSIDYLGKAITIRSRDGDPIGCVIDCKFQEHGFQFVSGEGPQSVLSGIMIIRGKHTAGGAIRCIDASPKIDNCIIADTHAPFYINKASPRISNCLVYDNQHQGPAFDIVDSPTCSIDHCTISDNGDPDAPLNIDMPVIQSALSICIVTNSIIANNYGPAVITVSPPTPVFTCSDIFGNFWNEDLADAVYGGDNISADPLFDPQGAPFRQFHANSLCLSDNSPIGCGQIGAPGEIGESHELFGLYSPDFAGFKNGFAAWGDYDGDGLLDLALSGETAEAEATYIYKQFSTGFSLEYTLPEFKDSTIDWGDFDLDGDLDLLITGYVDPVWETRIYRFDRESQQFNAIPIGTKPTTGPRPSRWIDYDNDGDLDILVAGKGFQYWMNAIIYHNEAGVFSQKFIGVSSNYNSAMDWGDFDIDGDQDLVYAEKGRETRIYENIRGGFKLYAKLGDQGLEPSVQWCDYDCDGDLDLLLTGSQYQEDQYTHLFRNDLQFGFTRIKTGLPDLYEGSAVWGDFDNNGWPDIFMSGFAGEKLGNIARLYRNDFGSFHEVEVPFEEMKKPCVACADFDRDGDLDILIAGEHDQGPRTLLYENRSKTPNRPPDQPAVPESRVDGNEIVLSWEATGDAETPGPGLSYNVRVGTTPGGSEILEPASDPITGTLSVPEAGVAGNQIRLDLSLLPPGEDIYWSVQSVDAGFTGSQFTPVVHTPWLGMTRCSEIEFQGFCYGSVAWGDYDNDGDLDILLRGSATSQSIDYKTVQIYKNQGDYFELTNFGAPGIRTYSACWGDYDNDGDLDILLAGSTFGYNSAVRICKNDDGEFLQPYIGLHPYGDYSNNYSACWSDFDNDGDLDISYISNLSSVGTIRLMENVEGEFVEIENDLPGLQLGSLAWADYDNDADIDLLLSGNDEGGFLSRLYRNTNGNFEHVSDGNLCSELAGLDNVVSAWIIDHDSSLFNAVLMGQGDSACDAFYMRNQGGNCLVPVSSDLPCVYSGSLAAGDFDNDGYQDLLMTGRGEGWLFDLMATVCRGNANLEQFDGVGLAKVHGSAAAWGDYDNDGDLDIFLIGETIAYQYISRIYENLAATPNQPPSAPTNLSGQLEGSILTMNWDAAEDAETESMALTYNLRVGTTPGGAEIMSPMADPSNGYRKIPAFGNAFLNRTWTLDLSGRPAFERIYWSVQAVDAAFAGSEFAAEQVIEQNQ